MCVLYNQNSDPVSFKFIAGQILGQKLRLPSSLILVLYNYAGDKFDLKEFHDVVLLESALPMSILEELIEQYISTHK